VLVLEYKHVLVLEFALGPEFILAALELGLDSSRLKHGSSISICLFSRQRSPIC